jgi:hypothetical protein
MVEAVAVAIGIGKKYTVPPRVVLAAVSVHPGMPGAETA